MTDSKSRNIMVGIQKRPKKCLVTAKKLLRSESESESRLWENPGFSYGFCHQVGFSITYLTSATFPCVYFLPIWTIHVVFSWCHLHWKIVGICCIYLLLLWIPYQLEAQWAAYSLKQLVALAWIFYRIESCIPLVWILNPTESFVTLCEELFWWHLARGIPGVWQKRPTAAPGVENLALGPATTWR